MILEGDGIYLKAGDSHHYKPIDSTSINGARSETKVVEHCMGGDERSMRDTEGERLRK